MEVWLAMEMDDNGPRVISVHRTEKGAHQAIQNRVGHVWTDGPFGVEN